MFSKFMTAAAVTLAALTFSNTTSLASTNDTFRCDLGGQFGFIQLSPEEGIARYETLEGAVDLVSQNNGTYLNDGLEMSFEPNGNGATLWTGDASFPCSIVLADNERTATNSPQNQATLLNAVGRSLGGKLRSGPGTNFAQSGSLAENTWLTILNNSGVPFNGYDWFEVTTDSGKRGYQWGGIMCSNGQLIKGIYQQCQNPAETKPNTQTHASGAVGGKETMLNAVGRSLGGKLRSGPGTNFGQSGSLKEGTWVTILTNTGVNFNGYDWFEITTDDGKRGYQWGGIMCSNGQLIKGIYQQC